MTMVFSPTVRAKAGAAARTTAVSLTTGATSIGGALAVHDARGGLAGLGLAAAEAGISAARSSSPTFRGRAGAALRTAAVGVSTAATSVFGALAFHDLKGALTGAGVAAGAATVSAVRAHAANKAAAAEVSTFAPAESTQPQRGA